MPDGPAQTSGFTQAQTAGFAEARTAGSAEAQTAGSAEAGALAPQTPAAGGGEALPALRAEPQSLLGIIAAAARDPAVDVGKMQALLDMQQRVLAVQAEADFNAAFARLAPELPRIAKRGVVEYPVNKNQPQGPKEKAFNFARYEDIDAAIKPLLLEHGFVLSFNSEPRPDGGGLIVTGTLSHIGGHCRRASIPLALDASGGKNNLQGMGSTFSYGKRYTTTMLLNLVYLGEDDDGVRGGKQYLTMEQKQQLTAMLQRTKADLDGFLDFIGADSVDDIERADFPRAMNALAVKLRQMEARAKQGGTDGEGAPAAGPQAGPNEGGADGKGAP